MTTLQATVVHSPSHWNRVCACMIPASATAEVILEQTEHSLSRLYAEVLPGEAKTDTPIDMCQLAVSRLIEQLRERGLRGTLKITRC